MVAFVAMFRSYEIEGRVIGDCCLLLELSLQDLCPLMGGTRVFGFDVVIALF